LQHEHSSYAELHGSSSKEEKDGLVGERCTDMAKVALSTPNAPIGKNSISAPDAQICDVVR
jgi:hypothetical protein